MPFTQRNLYYLRTSPHVVLQSILYLDPKHLRWMNSLPVERREEEEDDEEEGEEDGNAESSWSRSQGDIVLAKALQVLKTRIMPKLVGESAEGGALGSTNKKENVDVHVDVDFQMAYFFKKVTGRHAVLLKEKSMVFPHLERKGKQQQKQQTNQGENDPRNASMPPPAFPASAANRTQSPDTALLNRPSPLASRQDLQVGESVVQEGENISKGNEELQVSKKRRGVEGTVLGVRIKEEDDNDAPIALEPSSIPESGSEEGEDGTIDLDADDDEPEDKKPRLQVKYSGFKIFGKMLVMVIEPSRSMKRRAPNLFTERIDMPSRRISETPHLSRSTEEPEMRSMRAPNARGRSELEDYHPRDSRSISGTPGLGRGLFRGTPSDYEPTPTPEPESRLRTKASTPGIEPSGGDDESDESNGSDNGNDQSASFMLASQMLEGGDGGEGNDIDDEAGD